MKISPLVIVAGVGAALLVMRARAATPKVLGNTQKTADYHTPTDIAASLARVVVALTQGVATPPVAGIAKVESASLPLTGDLLADSAAWFAKLDTPAPFSSSPFASWQAPTYQSSAVNSPSVSRYSSSVDTIAAAPVYSIDDDFLLNPLSLV